MPAELNEKFEKVQAVLWDGGFVVWNGPILGQDGKEVVKKDEVTDDKFTSGIDFHVKGVEGKVPPAFAASGAAPDARSVLSQCNWREGLRRGHLHVTCRLTRRRA